MDKFMKIALLQCALFLHCVVSETEFFRFYGPTYRDTNFTQTATDVVSLTLHRDLHISCGVIKTLQVYASGRAVLSGADNARLMVFNVFGVEAGDVAARVVNYRFLSVAQERSEVVTCMKEFYTRYFPRETPTTFEPTTTLLVTWQITQEQMSSTDMSMNNDIFQMAMATQGNRSLIAFFYEQIQWGQPTAEVSIQTCGSGSWRPPGTKPPGETVVTSSNLGSRTGEWIFLVPENGLVIPAVICSPGCSIANGYCTEANTCLCRPNWSGDNCDVPVCSSGCVNGNCNSPQNCTCNAGWQGISCNTAICPNDCIYGNCIAPNNCTCRSGWSGVNCTIPVCQQDCGCFGFCTGPNHCSCVKGYEGSTCDPTCTSSSTCEDGCVNGNCTAPYTCTCATGWMGACCNETVPVPSATPTTTTTTPVETNPTEASSSLSGSTIGAIAGSIAALVVIVVVIAIIFIIALISC